MSFNIKKEIKQFKKRIDDLKLSVNKHYSTQNPCFFITGGTGFIGTKILCYITELYPYSNIYVLMRDRKNHLAKDRLNSIFDNHLIKNTKNIKMIKGNYNKQNMGISHFDQDTLSKKVDCILHFGCNTNYTYDYNKSKQSVIEPSLFILKLASTYKKKIIIYSDSCIRHVYPLYPTSMMYGFHKGYCISKYINYQLMTYARDTLDIDINIMTIGYAQSSHNNTPDYTDALESVWFSMIQLQMFPNFDFYIDYSDIDVVLQKVLDPKQLFCLPAECSVHCKKPIYWKSLFPIFQSLYPDMKRVSPLCFRQQLSKLFRQYPLVSYIGTIENDGFMTDHLERDMNAMFRSVLKQPEKNLDIPTPSKQYIQFVIKNLKRSCFQ